MGKTNKELAVDLTCAYIRARYANGPHMTALDGQTLAALVKDAYSAVQALDAPDSAAEM